MASKDFGVSPEASNPIGQEPQLDLSVLDMEPVAPQESQLDLSVLDMEPRQQPESQLDMSVLDMEPTPQQKAPSPQADAMGEQLKRAAQPEGKSSVIATPPPTSTSAPTGAEGVAPTAGINELQARNEARARLQANPNDPKAQMDYKFWQDAIQRTSGIATQGLESQATLEQLNPLYQAVKGGIRGVSMGTVDKFMEYIEKKVGGDIVRPETTAEVVASSVGDLVGSLIGMGKIAKGVGAWKKLADLPKLRKAMALNLTTSAIYGGVRNSMDLMFNPDVDTKTASANFGQMIGSVIVGTLAGVKIPPGAMNWIGQVGSALGYDILTDKYWRGRMENQSWKDWFIAEELPNLAAQILFASLQYKGDRNAAKQAVKAKLLEDDGKFFVTKDGKQEVTAEPPPVISNLPETTPRPVESMPDIQGELSRNQLKSAFKLDDEQAEATLVLARAMGLDTSKITAEAGGKPVTDEGQMLLAETEKPVEQKSQRTVQGMTEFVEDGKSLVKGFASANFSTGIHEISHVARRQLFNRDVAPEQRMGISNDDIKVAETWAGTKDGVWTRKAEERWARGFERYMRDGQFPNSRVKSVFDKIANWMRDIYQNITQGPLKVKISPEMRKVFDKLITRSERIPEITKRMQDAQARQASMPPIATKNFFDAGNQAKAMGIDVKGMTSKTQIDAKIAKNTSGLMDAEARYRDAIPKPFDRDAFVASKPIQEGVSSGVMKMIKDNKRPDLIYNKLEEDGFANAANMYKQIKRSQKRASQTLTEEGRDIDKNVDMLRAAADQPGRMAIEQLKSDIAQKAQTLPPEQTASELINKEHFSPEDYVLAPRILDILAKKTYESGKRNDDMYMLASTLSNKMYEAKGDWGRIGRLLRDVLPPAERNRATFHSILMSNPGKGIIGAVKTKIFGDNPEARLKAQADKYDSVIKTLKQQGMDIAKWGDEQWSDPDLVKALAQKASTEMSSGKGKFMEYYIGNLLSGPQTHVTNVLGNEMNIQQQFVLNRIAEASFNTLFNKPGAAQLRDIMPIVRSTWSLPNARKYFNTFIDAWYKGESTISEKYKAKEGQTVVEKPEQVEAIKGTFGKVVRKISKDVLVGLDEAAKQKIMDFEVAYQAKLRARKMGIPEDAPEFQRFIDKEVADPMSASSQKAMDNARVALFQGELGVFGKQLLKIRGGSTLAGFLFPFVTTPINIFKTGIKISTGYGGVRDILKSIDFKNMTVADKELFVKGAAQSLVTLGYLATIYANKDKISGSQPLRYSEEKAQEGVLPAYSIRFMGKNWSYRRIEPFASIVALQRDFIEALDQNSKGASDKALKSMANAVGNQLKDKFYLRTFATFSKFMENPDSFRDWATTAGMSLINPAVSRQTEQAFGNYVYETRPLKEKGQMLESLAYKAIPWAKQYGIANPLQKMGFDVGPDKLLQPAHPKVDKWGNDVKVSADYKDVTDEKVQGALFRLFSPVLSKPVSPFERDHIIYNYNKNTIGTEREPFLPAELKKFYTDDKYKTDVYYNRDEWYNVQRIAGKTAAKRIDEYIEQRKADGEPIDINNPSKNDIDVMRDMFTEARKFAIGIIKQEKEGQ